MVTSERPVWLEQDSTLRKVVKIGVFGALILPVLINAFSVIVLRQFFTGIPGEVIDSARIDGANDLQILTRVVLPLSKGGHRRTRGVLSGAVTV